MKPITPYFQEQQLMKVDDDPLFNEVDEQLPTAPINGDKGELRTSVLYGLVC
jgi:hypothetical protein